MNSVSSCLECFGPGMLLHYQEPGLILSVFHSLWRNQSSWLERLSICHKERAGDSPASQGRGRIWSTQMTWALGLTLKALSRTAYFRTVQLQAHPCFLSLNLNRMSSQGSPKDWKPGGVYSLTGNHRCLSNLLEVFLFYQTKVFPPLWENRQRQLLGRYPYCLSNVFGLNILRETYFC